MSACSAADKAPSPTQATRSGDGGDLGTLLRRSAEAYGQGLGEGLRAWLDWFGSDCCAVPTQDCPPPGDAGEIVWEPCPGSKQARAVVEVRNTGRTARDFRFEAGPLGPLAVQVQPAQALLAPGASISLTVVVSDLAALPPSTDWLAGTLRILGSHVQTVGLRLRVKPAEEPRLSVDHGDPPQRITALHWSRHWQCVEDCAPLPQKDERPGIVGSVPAAPPAVLAPPPQAPGMVANQPANPPANPATSVAGPLPPGAPATTTLARRAGKARR